MLSTTASVTGLVIDTVTGNDIATETTTVVAPIITFTVDEVDPGSYGFGFGTDQHRTALVATFTGSETSTYYLQVTGWDIDYSNEISIHLNGTQIGQLTKGPNNDLNEGDVFTLEPPLVVTGQNTLEFRERVTGWTWGVTELAVLSAPPAVPVVALTVDVVDTGSYGHNYGTDEHETVLPATFTANGTSTYYLQATGYDIDYGDEISVYLNEQPIGFLTAGPNNGLNGGDLFTLPPALAVAGPNTIEFRQRTVGWTWGVYGSRCTECSPDRVGTGDRAHGGRGRQRLVRAQLRHQRARVRSVRDVHRRWDEHLLPPGHGPRYRL